MRQESILNDYISYDNSTKIHDATYFNTKKGKLFSELRIFSYKNVYYTQEITINRKIMDISFKFSL